MLVVYGGRRKNKHPQTLKDLHCFYLKDFKWLKV